MKSILFIGKLFIIEPVHRQNFNVFLSSSALARPVINHSLVSEGLLFQAEPVPD